MLSSLGRYLDIRLSRLGGRAPRTLPILLLWVTDRCNLKCRMCGDQWRADQHQARERLTLPEIEGVIAAARRLRTMIISLTGGEPLLHPHIDRILEQIREAGIAAHMCTNGTLLNEERVRRLARTSLKSISVSIDSPTPEVHDQLRGQEGAFRATANGIGLLRAAMPGLRININCTVSKVNVHSLTEMVRLTKELKCDKLNLGPIHTNLQHKHKPKEHFAGMVFTPNELSGLSEELDRASALAKELGVRTSSSRFLQGIPKAYTEPLRWHTCYAGYASVAVSPWGEVAPCVDMESTLNVRTMPLDQIWRSDAFQRLREQVDCCEDPCWDTTNTEIAIRFSLAGVLAELKTMLQDLSLYGRGGR